MNDDVRDIAEAAEFNGLDRVFAEQAVTFLRRAADMRGHGCVTLDELNAVLFGSRLDLSGVLPEIFVLKEFAGLACLHILPIDIGRDEGVFDAFEARFLQRGEGCVDAAECFDVCVMDRRTDLHNHIPFRLYLYFRKIPRDFLSLFSL